MITQKELNGRFTYKGGSLFYKKVLSKKMSVGDRAGYVSGNGYRLIGIGNERFYEHRLVFY